MQHEGRVRSPDVSRRWRLAAVVAALVTLFGFAAPSATGASPVVVNGDLENAPANSPSCFTRSGWGDGNVTWAPAPSAHSGSFAQAVTIDGYVDGDRKLMISESAECAPAVTPGGRYDLQVWYRSSTAANALTVFRHSAAGWTYWTDLKTLPAMPEWTLAEGLTPEVPEGTDSISFGISLWGNGTLQTDDYAIALDGVLAPQDDELSSNPGLESGGATPAGWFLAGWGDARVTSGVTAAAHSGTRAYRINLSGRTVGDTKLLPTETAAPAVQPGKTYDLSVWYHSTSQNNNLTVFSHTASGWGYWTDLAALPATDEWTRATVRTPAIEAGVDAIAWGVSISADGTLVTDDYSTVLARTATDVPTGPAAEGSWSVLTQHMPVRAMHATVLKTGKVLLIAGSGNDVDAFGAGTFRASLWDPVSDVWTTVPVPKDMFCSGHVTLPDGRVLIQGGTKSYPTNNGGADYGGLKDSWIFDPVTETFIDADPANGGHWYPTLTELGNGDIWMAGGLKEDTTGAVNTELWSSSGQEWLPGNEVPQSWSFWGLYPHMFLMSDGRLFYSGGHVFGNGLPGSGASVYDWKTGSVTDVPGLREKDLRDQSASVLLPPAQDQKVLITGGGNINTATPAIGLTDVIDLNAASSVYTPGPDLPGPGKMYLNGTILPDRTVLITNGGKLNRDDTTNVHTAAVYDPEAQTWTSVAADPIGRNYHSTAVLLPDGRVAVFGSNPGDGSYELRVSVYSPSYLFRGGRPQISGAPSEVGYGDSVQFGVATSGTTIRWAQLMRPMSVSHQMDSNMRLVDVPIVVQSGVATAQIPSNPNLLPPGPYLLNVTDSAGVPSSSVWVTVG